MSNKFLTSTGLLVALVLFLAVNVLSNQLFTSARIDLTEHGLYSLSDGTHKILEGLNEPVTLRFYLSKNLVPLLPGISGFVTRVKELLQEFEQASDGNLTLHIIDPEPFSEDEDRAVEYGLKGVPLAEGDTVFYFGLVGSGPTDEEHIVPFFQPEREEFLEYDLAKLVHQLAYPKQKVVGLLSSLPLGGGPASPMMPGAGGGMPPWIIHDQLQQNFELRSLSPASPEIPEDIDVLMIVHPKALQDSAQYAIDQFVLKGGRALVFVDPFAEADQSGGMPNNPMGGGGPKNSDLPKLFAAWGIELVPGKVLGDITFARRVQYRQGTRIQSADYPVWLDLPTSQFNAEEVVTAQLPKLTLASAGILKQREDAKTTLVPLIETDNQAMQIDVAKVQFVRDIGTLLNSYEPEDATFTIAARITGKVPSAFPDGPPHSNDQGSSPEGHQKESTDSINVIVVADTDMLQDYFWVQVQSFLGQRIGIPTAGNGTFVINALDNLTGSNDLISIRTRAGFNRPFTLVRSLQREAEQRFREREEQLQKRKRATERKIQELQSQKDEGSAMVLSPEQEQEIVHFRQELVQVRKDLRNVQHELRKNITSLESWLKMLNIGLMPLLIGLGGLYLSTRKHKGKE